jgi:hypothetical protein
MLWDVTEATHPVQLGFYDSGCCTRGVHEFEVESRSDLQRTFAYATVPAGTYPDSENANGLHDAAGKGDFRLIDITNPQAIRGFDVEGAAGGWPVRGTGLRCRCNYGHGAEPSDDGKSVFLSYWDSGYIELDLTNPASPVYVKRAAFPANADGDAARRRLDQAVCGGGDLARLTSPARPCK